jgi:shikimate dehydrogenase
VVVRDVARASAVMASASAVGLEIDLCTWMSTDFAALASSASVLVNTTPPAAVSPLVEDLARVPAVLDVIYHPWPTPLASAVTARGGMLATGLDMLLHQAFGQVEQFTGEQAPREIMRDALKAATGGVLPLPL